MNRFSRLSVGSAFFLSGASALVYQVAWQRILALHTGVGIYSVAMIVGAFMAGLGLGSYVGGLFSTRLGPSRALRAFALLELGVAAFGAASVSLYYDVLYLQAASWYSSPLRAGLLHFVSLLLPTALMGMSLPFLARATYEDAETAGRTVGFLYGINLLGASVGALLAPWLLIRYLGVRGAVLVAVAGNLAAAVIALVARPAAGSDAPEVRFGAPRTAVSTEPPRPFALWIALYALSGFCALSLEILWFRLMDVAAKSIAFTFGTMLFLSRLFLFSLSQSGIAP